MVLSMSLSQVKRKSKKLFTSGLAKDFLSSLSEEKNGTKESFATILNSIKTNKKLTREEKVKISKQLKNTFKTIGLIGAIVLPGGLVYLLVIKLLKLDKYILPNYLNKKLDK